MSSQSLQWQLNARHCLTRLGFSQAAQLLFAAGTLAEARNCPSATQEGITRCSQFHMAHGQPPSLPSC
jgi:hypothetical protein